MTTLLERAPRTADPRGDVLRLRVIETELLVPGIRRVVLGPAGVDALPPFAAGSHIVLDCGVGRNSYSLVNGGDLPERYEISVRLDEAGRGGSAYVHGLKVGDVILTSAPRSTFTPAATATKHLLVAGGIGITPILSHLRSATAWGQDAEIVYGFRPGYGAHLTDVAALCATGGAPMHLASSSAELVEVLDRLLARQPLGTHVYTCGPAGLIDAVGDLAARHGWPAARVHAEAFGVAGLEAGEPFAVRLRRSDRVIAVPSAVSMLEAIENAGVQTPSLCRTGVCGECRLAVTAGTPLHRDLVLSDAERAAGADVLPCVSRCDGDLLEVDL